MNSHLDVPIVSGKIMWARQLNEHLVMYLKRVQNVLGDDWDLYTEGQKIKEESLAFQQKLDVGMTFKNWMNEVISANYSVTGSVFQVVKDTRDKGLLFVGLHLIDKKMHLKVHFDPKLCELFKEVRLLISLGFQIPHSIMSLGRDSARIQPFVISLTETIQEYEKMSKTVEKYSDIIPLVENWRKEIRDLLVNGGSKLKWEFFVNIVSNLSV